MTEKNTQTKHIVSIPIDSIVQSPWQGRFYEISGTIPDSEEKHIAELMESIRQNGLMQPIVVRAINDGKYELIDGHRRVIAYRKLGIAQVNAIIKDYSEKEAQIFSVVGNLQRSNLTPIENAFAFTRILEQGIFENQTQLSIAIGKDKTYVGDILNILKMDQRIIDELVKNKTINDSRLLRIIRRAYPIDKESKNSDQQWALYQKVVSENLTRNQLNEYLRLQKTKNVISESGMNADEFGIHNPAVRNTIHQQLKTNRIKKDFSKRSVKLNFDLSGLSKEKREIIKKEIEKTIQELENRIEF